MTWKLHAGSLGVDYPAFGAVSVANAGLPAPDELRRSLPGGPDEDLIVAAARALATTLRPLTADLDVAGIQRLAVTRLGGADR